MVPGRGVIPPVKIDPEQGARVEIDRRLEQSGRQVEDADQIHVFVEFHKRVHEYAFDADLTHFPTKLGNSRSIL